MQHAAEGDVFAVERALHAEQFFRSALVLVLALFRRRGVLDIVDQRRQREALLFEFFLVCVERVPGKIDAERLLFEREFLHLRILCKRRDVVLGGGVLAHQVEQTDLTALLALAVARRLFEQSLVRRHQRRARIAEAVERARLDQTFHDALVDDAGLEAGQHVGHALVLAVFLALFDERLHRVRADVLDAVEPVAQLAVLDLEQHAALVDVGRQDLKAVVAQDRQILLHLFGVGDAVVDDRGEQLDLVISFVESGLIGQHRIGGCVRLVERVLGKSRHLVEDLVGGIFVDDADLDRAGDARFGKPDESAVGRIFRRFGRRAVEEDLALRLHDLGFFLAHRAAQHVRRPERIAGKQLSHLHDLFLIDETAVCHLENGSEQRMAVGDALGILL